MPRHRSIATIISYFNLIRTFAPIHESAVQAEKTGPETPGASL
jgi:hypothetical protein